MQWSLLSLLGAVRSFPAMRASQRLSFALVFTPAFFFVTFLELGLTSPH